MEIDQNIIYHHQCVMRLWTLSFSVTAYQNLLKLICENKITFENKAGEEGDGTNMPSTFIL